jgi:hypothetical protein
LKPGAVTAEEDRQQMMGQLGITELRQGANGSDPNAPNAANYEESKAEPFGPLPDALVMADGKRVTTPGMWWGKRRPELVELFNREVYGRVPAKTPAVRWEVVKRDDAKNGDVAVVTKTLLGHVDNSSDPAIKVDIQLSLTTPAGAKGRVPVVMAFDYPPEFWAEFAKRTGRPIPPPPPGPTWQQQVLSRGWGYAVLVPSSVQADNGAGLREGIIGLCNHGGPRKPEDWGALRAWAWGASRALDYFATDGAVDAKQVAIFGHSRFGKAALVTMAYEPRMAIGYISSSGEGGAKPSRRAWGELLENVAATNEYHWMAGNFLKYAGPKTVSDLPVDANELIALCAPRPLFVSGGAAAKGDGWVDAHGMFVAAVAAGPVYRLLGKRDLGTAEFPAMETSLVAGDLAFRQHSAGHTPAPNWPSFLAFAGRYLKSGI